MEELIRLVTDEDETIGIGLDDSNLFFRAGHRVISTRLMVGKFPNYQVPFKDLGHYEHFATFKSDELSQSIKRAIQTADQASLAVSMLFQDSKLKLNSATAELGESNEVLDSDFNGGELKILCNGNFLIDFLEPLGSQPVRIELKDSFSMMYLTGEKDDVQYFYCCVPMR